MYLLYFAVGRTHSLLTAHYLLLTTYYSLLTTHYSLLTTHYALLAQLPILTAGGQGLRGASQSAEQPALCGRQSVRRKQLHHAT